MSTHIAILNAGKGTDYLYGFVTGLSSISQLRLDIIDSDNSKGLFDNFHNVSFYNLRGDQNPGSPTLRKANRIIRYYYRLLKYAYQTNCEVFHIQWENKFSLFDRTVLNIYYKLLGKKLVFTAHNINAAARDQKDSIINKLTLKFMYYVLDHIIVHTQKMKNELIEKFNVDEEKISIIPHGINVKNKITNLTRSEARNFLKVSEEKKILLFFGFIDRYKGLELLIEALKILIKNDQNYHLIIAGKPKGNSYYMDSIKKQVNKYSLTEFCTLKLKFATDQEVEIYFKASDCLVLPYKNIDQSGVIFLAYSFGIPIIATDVGSFKYDIVEGKTGFICQPENPEDLAEKISRYYHSDLFKNLKINRHKIIKYANKKYSWEISGEKTFAVYKKLL